MPVPIEDFRDHGFHAALSKLKEGIATTRRSEPVKGNRGLIDRVEALKAVVPYVEARLQSVDPGLCPKTTLANIESQAQRAANELGSYVSNSNEGHLQNAEQSVDQLVVLCSQLPVPQAPADLQALGESIQESRRSIAGYLGSLKRQVNREEKRLSGLDEKLDEVKTEVEGQKGRVDKLVTEHQTQFSEAQEKRSVRFQELIENSTALYTEQKAELQKRLTKFEKDVSDYDDQARELLEALGVTSQTAALGHSARREMITARVWHTLAFLSLLGLIAVAIFAILPTLGDSFDVGVFAGRVFIGLTLAIAASYAGAQASRHSRREEYYRNLQLQLASLDPYLALMEPTERNEIKRGLAEKLFGTLSIGSGKDEGSASHEDLLKWMLKNVKG